MMMTTSVKSGRIGFIAFAASWGGLLFGFDTAVISGAIDLVRKQFSFSATAEGWFVSSGLLGCIIGVITAGLLADRIGRKPVLAISGVLFLISALGCALTFTMHSLVLYRLLGGVGIGIASVTSPLYITELVLATVRGRMVAFYQLSITLGILAAYFSNAFLLRLTDAGVFDNRILNWLFEQEVWRGMFLVMAIPSAVFIVFMLLVPESPRWFFSKNNKRKGIQALEKIYDKSSIPVVAEDLQKASVQSTGNGRSIFEKSLRLPLLSGVVLCVLQQFSGINAIIYYGPKIFAEAGLTGSDALQAQVIIGLVNMVFTTVAIYRADRFGRKHLLTVGLSGMIISLVTVGICFYTQAAGSVFLLFMLLVFIACFALSVGPVTWMLVNEIFPTDVRVKAVSFCTLMLWVAVWLVGQFFPWMLEHAGPAAVFWFFAACSLFNLWFCRRMLLETKGKSLEQIEEMYIPAH